MNLPQRAILILAALAVVITGTYVPFEYVENAGRISAGFGWIGMPPDDEAQVNVMQLAIEWLGISFVAAALWFAASPSHREKSLPDEARKAEHSKGNEPSRTEMVTEVRSATVATTGDHNGVKQKVPLRAFLPGFAVVAVIAIGAFVVRQAKHASSAEAPPSASDLCQFAANTVMLEQWALADDAVEPLEAAKTLFGSNAKRRWTVEKSEELAAKVTALRIYVNEKPFVRTAVDSWLKSTHANAPEQIERREWVRRLLSNTCMAG